MLVEAELVARRQLHGAAGPEKQLLAAPQLFRPDPRQDRALFRRQEMFVLQEHHALAGRIGTPDRVCASWL